MPDIDPWLPDRLRREASLIRSERTLLAAARKALTALLAVLREAMAGSRLDVSVLDRRMPQWRAIVSSTLMPSVESTFGNGYRTVLDTATWSPDPHITAYLDQVQNRLVRVADEVFDLIESQIDEGRRAGESIDTLTQRVDDVLADAGAERWHNRARVIARTETISAYNSGQFEAAADTAKALGVPLTSVRKSWLATADTRTRDSHRHTDGQPRGLTDPFSVGTAEGPKSPMMFPGDPRGPANEVIQCRCTLRFEFPDPPLAATQQALSADATLGDETPGGPVTTTLDRPVLVNHPLITWATTPSLLAAAVEALPVDGPAWHGVLAPEGVATGDRRKFAPDSLRWRELPLPLMWQMTTAQGHDGAVLVGRIDTIAREANLLPATGVFDTSPWATEATRLIDAKMMRGVSVDVDDATFVFETLSGDPLNSPEEINDAEDAVQVITDGRISGATLCTIPAFEEAFVALTLAAAGGPLPTAWITLDEPLVAGAVGNWLRQRRVPKGNKELSGRWADMFAMPVHGKQLNDFGNGSAIAHLDEVTDADGNRISGVYQFSPERQKFHHDFTRRAIEGITRHDPAEPGGRRPRFVLMGGGPAAGKSSVIKQRAGTDADLTVDKVIINPDIAKTGLTDDQVEEEGYAPGGGFDGIPEFAQMVDAGDEEAGGFAHEESSYMAKQVTQAALDEGQDALLDGTGDSSYDKLQTKILQAKSKGYEIDGVYVTAPTELALIRALRRFYKTGRGVDSMEIAVTHSNVSKIVPELGRTKIMDKVELFDTTDGGEPILIMEWPDSTLSGEAAFNAKPRILEPERYNTFLDKANQSPGAALEGAIAMIDSLLARDGDVAFDGKPVPRDELERVRADLSADLDNYNIVAAKKEHKAAVARANTIAQEADTIAQVEIPQNVRNMSDEDLNAAVDEIGTVDVDRRNIDDLVILAEAQRRQDGGTVGDRADTEQVQAPAEAPVDDLSGLSDTELDDEAALLDTAIAEADQADVEPLLARQRAVSAERRRRNPIDVAEDLQGLSEPELQDLLATAQAAEDWAEVDRIKAAIRATRSAVNVGG